MIPSFLINLFFSFLGILIIYGIGNSINTYSNKKYFNNLFDKLLFGNIFIIILSSIFYTNFNTIIVLVIIIWAYYHFIFKEKLSFSFKFNLNDYLYLTILTIIIYSFVYFLQYNPFNNSISENPDYYYYARAVSFLKTYGIETPYINTIHTYKNSAPYHYGDLWHTAFFSSIFNITPILSLTLISKSVLFINIYFGAIAIIENIVKKINYKHLIVAFLIFIISGISFYIPKDLFFTKGDWYSFNFVSWSKLALILLLFQKIILNISDYKTIFKYVFILSIIFNTTMPALFIFLGLFSFYLLIIKQLNLKKILFIFIIPLLIFLIYYFIFYKNFLFSNTTNNIETFNLNHYIKTFINITGSISIKVLLSIILFNISFIVIVKKDIIKEYTFHIFIIISISSILAYSIMHPMFDSVQLWFLIFMNTSTLVGFVIIIKLFFSNKIMFKGISLLLIWLSFYQFHFKINKKPLNNDINIIKEIITSPISNNIVFFKDSTEYKTAFKINVDVYPPLNRLLFYYPNYSPTCINTFDIPVPKEQNLKKYYNIINSNWTFSTFVDNNKKTDYTKEQIQFIKQQKIIYIWTSKKYKLKTEILNLTNNSIILSDSSRLYSIKN